METTSLRKTGPHLQTDLWSAGRQKKEWSLWLQHYSIWPCWGLYGIQCTLSVFMILLYLFVCLLHFTYFFHVYCIGIYESWSFTFQCLTVLLGRSLGQVWGRSKPWAFGWSDLRSLTLSSRRENNLLNDQKTSVNINKHEWPTIHNNHSLVIHW